MPVSGLTSESVTPYERARRYVAVAGPSIQGSGGDNHKRSILWSLVCKFDLTDAEYREILEEWNATCDPPWKHGELIKALERALRKSEGHPDAQQKHDQPLRPRERSRRELQRLTTLPPEPIPEEPDPAWRERLEGFELLEGTPGAAYLQSRGIPPALAHGAAVVYHPSFYGRPAVLFPLRDQAGVLVSVSGRYIDGEKPKVRDVGAKGAGVFLTPGALTADPVILVEGPMDALSLAALGQAALALMGCSWPFWLPLSCAWKRVLLATDADDAGDQAAARLTAALRKTGAKPERLSPSPAKDWNQALEWYGPEVLRKALQVGISENSYSLRKVEV